MIIAFSVIVCFLLFAYVPLTLVIRDRIPPVKRIPLDEHLRQQHSLGLITTETFETEYEKALRARPTEEAPWPLVEEGVSQQARP